VADGLPPDGWGERRQHQAILAAFLANLGIAIAKFVAFLFTGAASAADSSTRTP
jgi:divalent metal cation (Fe/Co/Zn/Cd) transporter